MLGDYAYCSYFIFFFFIFLFASLRCVHIHILLQIFLFPVKHPFPVKRPNLRFHGSPHSRYFSSGLTAAFLPLYASFPDSREELQMMIPFEQWRHFFFFLSFFSLFAKDSRSAFADSIFYVDKENRACLSPVLLLLLLPSSLSSFSNTFERIIPFRNARRRLLSVLRSTRNEKEAKLTTSMIKAVVIPRYKVLTFVCST